MANVKRNIGLGASGVAVILVLGLAVWLGWLEKSSVPTGLRKKARIHGNIKNLEAIFSALQSYARETGDHLPSSLEELVKQGYLDRLDAKDCFSGQDEIGFQLVSAGGTWDDCRDGLLVVQTRHHSGDPFFVLKADGTALVLENMNTGEKK
ncbi:MAG: hypothetical protein HQ581_18370 [Planctomycetes bacterium]|nr:hypothetical protein [Planctomycetota bacterium]